MSETLDMGKYADRDFSSKTVEVLPEGTYKVSIDKPITREHAIDLKKGIRLSDGKTEPAEIYIIPNTKNLDIGIIIHEGRNRQVRRMFESLGYEIKKLDRIAYGDISYEGLKKGQWRLLTRREINYLLKLNKD